MTKLLLQNRPLFRSKAIINVKWCLALFLVFTQSVTYAVNWVRSEKSDKADINGTAFFYEQRPFISVWKTDNPGTSGDTQITIPTVFASTVPYIYEIHWENVEKPEITGSVPVATNSQYTVTFPEPGTYRLKISGQFPAIRFINTGDKSKIIDIEQWGDSSWEALSFNGCNNLVVTATDAPDLSNVTSLSQMFNNAASLTGDFSSWDVSNVTNMSGMFSGTTNFTGDLSSWNVGNVTVMSDMFNNATSFNGDISNWDVGNVTTMNHMFYNATHFNGDIGSWNVKNLKSCTSMFYGAAAFNKSINSWELDEVTNMSNMFYGAASFNQDLSDWDVSKVTNMSNMFSGATSFNQDLSSWDMSGVTIIGGMFRDATSFNGNISNWDMGNVSSMISMFQGATSFNQDISGWDVSNVTNMSNMFSGATSFNGDISGWDVSNATNLSSMFSGATSFNGDISTWKVDGVTTMLAMFRDATSFNGDINSWKVGNVTSMRSMFQNATSFNGDISLWEVGNVNNMRDMFQNATNFTGDISNWDVGKVTTVQGMFQGATNFNGDLGGWDLSNVTNMSSLFSGATSFNGDISGWDVGNVTNMVMMFEGATSFDQNLGNWNVGKVTNMSQMLNGSGISQNNYDLLLQGWLENGVKENVSMGVEGLNYCNGLEARKALIENHNWVISGDELECGQIITFGPIEEKEFEDVSFELEAVASSGLAVTYTSSDESVATIEGNTVTIVGAGETTITASQAGDGTYAPATEVQQVLKVNRKDQSITFGPLAEKTFGDGSFVLDGFASSDLEVAYTSSDETVATIEGNTVTIVGAGETTITASQAGDGTYAPAEEVEQVLKVNRKDQSITFGPIAEKELGDGSFVLDGFASSGLEITYSSSDESVATIEGNTVTIAGAGETTITASQAGDGTYAPATEVQQVLKVNRKDQSITFGPIAEKELGDESFVLDGFASSGLEITYSSSDESVATIEGNTVTIVGAGETMITASQAGDETYAPAEEVEQMLKVKGKETVVTGPFEIKDVPNALFPNGNSSSNRTWGLSHLGAVENLLIRIFDKSGRVVFSTADPAIEWDGRYGGKEVPEGVYFFTIEHSGRKVQGSVSVIY